MSVFIICMRHLSGTLDNRSTDTGTQSNLVLEEEHLLSLLLVMKTNRLTPLTLTAQSYVEITRLPSASPKNNVFLHGADNQKPISLMQHILHCLQLPFVFVSK